MAVALSDMNSAHLQIEPAFQAFYEALSTGYLAVAFAIPVTSAASLCMVAAVVSGPLAPAAAVGCIGLVVAAKAELLLLSPFLLPVKFNFDALKNAVNRYAQRINDVGTLWAELEQDNCEFASEDVPARLSEARQRLTGFEGRLSTAEGEAADFLVETIMDSLLGALVDLNVKLTFGHPVTDVMKLLEKLTAEAAKAVASLLKQ